MNCRKVKRLLSSYIDRQLSPETLRAVDDHLQLCENCRRELFDLRQSAGALSQMPADDPGDVFNRLVAVGIERARRGQPTVAMKLALGFAAVCLAVAIAIPIYVANLDHFISRQDVYVVCGDTLIPGARASARIVVANRGADNPVQGAHVTLALQSVNGGRRFQLMSGKTDEAGTLSGNFLTPDRLSGNYRLITTASSRMGKDSLMTPVELRRAAKVLLTTDKPIYQPGQTIHIRTLSLLRPSLKPASGDKVKLVVEDPKGNKVFQKEISASKWGVAAADFQLGDEIGLGRYKITAALGETETQKIVTVKRYVLPKFKVDLETDRTFYLPGQTIKGTVTSRYFFGKNVADGKVRVTLSALGVRFDKFAEITGKTDSGGVFTFEAAVPKLLAGQPLDKGNATVRIAVEVTDTAEHREEITRALPVANDPIRIAVVPESGQFAPGLENVVYVVTSYPDGQTAQATTSLTFDGRRYETESDHFGVSEFRIMPPEDAFSIRISAEARNGLRSSRRFDFEGSDATPDYLERDVHGPMVKDAASLDSVLIRLDRSIYSVGDTARITILSTKKSGSIYLDAVRDSQTVLTQTLRLKRGRADAELDISDDFAGSLTLSAYVMSPVGVPVRDTTTALVWSGDTLRVNLTPDRKRYRPGEKAVVGVQVTGVRGRGVAAAVGVNIVDESVFSVEEQAPGLAGLYFALQEEILKPRYQTKFPFDDVYRDSYRDPQRAILLTQAALLEPRPQMRGDLPEWADLRAVRWDVAVFPQRAVKIILASAVNADESKTSAATQQEKDQRVYNVQERFETEAIIVISLFAIFLPIEVIYAYRKRLRLLLTTSALAMLFLATTAVLLMLSGLGRADLWGVDIAETGASFLLSFFILWLVSGILAAKESGGWAAAILGFIFLVFVAAILFPVFAKAKCAARRATVMSSLKEIGLGFGMHLQEAGPRGARRAGQPVRVRQFFPETLYSNPSVITDESGRAHIDLKVADSITTWRISALASSMNGEVGSANAPLRVFQEFFVDLDLPVSVTQGDVVSVPVAVYNYLPRAQKVSVTLRRESWFAPKGQTSKALQLGPNAVGVVRFPIRFTALGRHALTVEARSDALADAVRREITVYPNGQEQTDVRNGMAYEDTRVAVNVPRYAIPGASKLLVKIYPGAFSQAVDELGALLQVPYGCFEQTSSITYPNVLVLKYLQATKKDRPEISLKAEQFISLGYQRLLTFEVPGGGFDWFGMTPANTVLSAYGIMELADMADVSTVDRGLIDRSMRLLERRQQADGSWKADSSTHTWESLSKLAITSYVAWAAAEGGFGDSESINRACGYIRKHVETEEDPYVLALAANALVAGKDEDAAAVVLDRLADSALVRNGRATWTSNGRSLTYGSGSVLNTETTALAAYSFLRSHTHPDRAKQALAEIVATRDTTGAWNTTQATILALKALLAGATEGAGGKGEARLIVNGKAAGTVRLFGDDTDVMSLVDVTPFARPGRNVVEIELNGRAKPAYQVLAKYYVPWSRVPKKSAGILRINVVYGKLRVENNGTVNVTAKIRAKSPVKMAIVDLGLPPGFAVTTDDLDALRAKKVIERYEITPRQIIFYLRDLTPRRPLNITYRLRALYPVKVTAPSSSVYDYYNPSSVRSTVGPVVIESI